MVFVKIGSSVVILKIKVLNFVIMFKIWYNNTMGESIARSEPLLDVRKRSPGWLDFATATSVVLGLAEVIIGRFGNSNALLANAVETLDNTTYGLDSLAARSELNRRRNHRLRRFAGSIICAASLCVAGNSIYDLVDHKFPEIGSEYAALSGTSVILNGSYVLGLKKNSEHGTTHRDAFRHAMSDTASSLIATGAIIASTHGYPMVDAWTGIGLSGLTIVMTAPLNKRITGADSLFVSQSSVSENNTA